MGPKPHVGRGPHSAEHVVIAREAARRLAPEHRFSMNISMRTAHSFNGSARFIAQGGRRAVNCEAEQDNARKTISRHDTRVAVLLLRHGGSVADEFSENGGRAFAGIVEYAVIGVGVFRDLEHIGRRILPVCQFDKPDHARPFLSANADAKRKRPPKEPQ
jgi:hypothetical protein